jgi:hypothetical protein
LSSIMLKATGSGACNLCNFLRQAQPVDFGF